MSVDFTKTSTQVSDTINQQLESLQRQLLLSRGNGEKGAGAMTTVVLAAVVLAVQFVFSLFVDTQTKQAQPKPQSTSQAVTFISDRDRTLVENHLSRIDSQIGVIGETKNRVAPSMAIDGSLNSVRSSVEDLRGILGVPTKPASPQQVPQQ